MSSGDSLKISWPEVVGIGAEIHGDPADVRMEVHKVVM